MTILRLCNSPDHDAVKPPRNPSNGVVNYTGQCRLASFNGSSCHPFVLSFSSSKDAPSCLIHLPIKPHPLNQSGGINVNADTVNIYGDVTGRDKTVAGGSSSGSSGSTPPLELSLRFEKVGDGDNAPLTVNASIIGQSSATEAVKFKVPLDAKVLTDLRWYLELYPQWPVGPDYDRALGIEAKLQTWGKQLFEAAFSTPKLMRVYEQFRLKDGGKSITIDATDPYVLQLPWELLADEGGYVFTQRPPINVRRKLRVAREPKRQAFTLPVRILMLISRPEGEHIGFLDPRSSAQTLLDAIEPLGERVTVEFLYPPTLKALTQRVRDPQAPPVHVVHFDGHGVYRPDTGLGYLLFENDEHQAQLVNAADLGTLLNDTGVPLMLLDACQTAQTDQANPFGSVASKLIEAGIGSVLAMNYSVLVSATRLLTAAFYGGLAHGQTIGQAVDAARFAMLMEPERARLYRDSKEEAIPNCAIGSCPRSTSNRSIPRRSLHRSIDGETERQRDRESSHLPGAWRLPGRTSLRFPRARTRTAPPAPDAGRAAHRGGARLRRAERSIAGRSEFVDRSVPGVGAHYDRCAARYGRSDLDCAASLLWRTQCQGLDLLHVRASWTASASSRAGDRYAGLPGRR